MVSSDREATDLQVKVVGKTIVKAVDPPAEPKVVTLSNFDLLSGRFPVSVYYAYSKPDSCDFPSIVATLQTSLAKVLRHYYPFAGRLVPGPRPDEPEIICNNEGVEFTEAQANIPLSALNFHDLSESLQKNLVPVPESSPLSIQVTGYPCGGFSVGLSFDHATADAHGFTLFLVAWSEMARKGYVSVVPDHRRAEAFKPRSPPSYGPEIDRMLTSCSLEEIIKLPHNDITLKRLYYIQGSDVQRLQELCSSSSSTGGRRRTKVESFSAYLWKALATAAAAGGKSDGQCKMGWLTDGRTRLSTHSNDLSNYVGNVVSMALGEAEIQVLQAASLSDVGEMVHRAIDEVTNKDHFNDLIDWIECKRPGLVLAKILLGRGGPAIMVSSGQRAAVAEVDFGYGTPVVGTCYSLIPRLGAAYVNPQPSGRGDGSWVVFAILWPELAAALESDPERIFRPVTAAHLGLSV
ncbi:coniferyl alcohol acyltransferase [Aristolochia californica]|uniref:coniferyl alcohol acyltransferase n=1 Tax=Aristolochia californica TaxID=171875 RepID=UPI0035DA4E51